MKGCTVWQERDFLAVQPRHFLLEGRQELSYGRKVQAPVRVDLDVAPVRSPSLVPRRGPLHFLRGTYAPDTDIVVELVSGLGCETVQMDSITCVRYNSTESENVAVFDFELVF